MISTLKSGYAIITAVRMATAKNGSPYAVLKLKNSKLDLSINIWGCPKPCPFKVGKMVTFTQVEEKNGFYSSKYECVRMSDCGPDNPLREYLQSVVSEEEWMKLGSDLTINMNPQDRTFFSDQFHRLYLIYKDKVAARSNHHNYPGGLLQHTYELLNIYYHVKPSLPYKANDFIVIMGCLYHDFGKVAEYDENSELNPDFFLMGHPYIGAKTAAQVLQKAGYSNELVMHTQHSILAHHGYKAYGSPVVPSSPEAFTVHMCDLWSGWGVEYESPQGTTISVFNESIQVQHYVDTREG